MALLLKCGAVFLHIPKTGGYWVAEVLQEQGLVRRSFCHIHADMQQVQRYLSTAATLKNTLLAPVKARLPLGLKKKVKQAVRPRGATSRWPGQSVQIDRTPFMFCFVRHPLSWYESIWRYMCRWDWPKMGNRYDANDWHPTALLNGLGDADFNRFVRNVIEDRPGFVTELFGRYTLPGMNHVGRQERLADDLVQALTRLEIDFDESRIHAHPPVNASEPGKAPIAWDPGLRRETLRLEAAAIARYGY